MNTAGVTPTLCLDFMALFGVVPQWQQQRAHQAWKAEPTDAANDDDNTMPKVAMMSMM